MIGQEFHTVNIYVGPIITVWLNAGYYYYYYKTQNQDIPAQEKMRCSQMMELAEQPEEGVGLYIHGWQRGDKKGTDRTLTADLRSDRQDNKPRVCGWWQS